MGARNALRASQVALAFIERFEAALGLSDAVRSLRRASMSEDPRSFFSANPALFHADLEGDFADEATLLDRTAPTITVLGDAHLLNFGVFRGPDGEPHFGPNDFDQSGPGSPELDLARLAVSVELLAREEGFGKKAERRLLEELGQHYVKELSRLAQRGEIKPPHLSASEADGPIKRRIEKAARVDRAAFLAKLTDPPHTHFRHDEEVRPISNAERAGVIRALAPYSKRLAPDVLVALPLEVLDVAEKLGSGGSSLGLKRFRVLVAARAPDALPLVLELKALLPATLAGETEGARGDASRVPGRKTLLTGLRDPLTGWIEFDAGTMLVREYEPEKAKLTSKDLDTKEELVDIAEQVAELLARCHARDPSAARALRDWVGEDAPRLFKRLASFAERYADQVEQDHRAFLRGGPTGDG